LLVRNEGNRQVKRNIDHYNLDMIIALGYRVQSQIATCFRRWATERLHEYIQKGFAMDDERLKQGNSRYFRELLQRIRDIRSSKRNFYQQVTDIYATATDYDPRSELTKDFLSLLELAYKYFHRYPIEHPLNYSLSNSVAETLNQILNQKSDFSPVKILHDAISNNFTDVNFCLDDAYLLIPLAKEYARKLFITEYKTTPLKFLLARRIEFAKQLLSRKSQVNLRINEIAESCGFADPAYFSRIFKKLTGVTPNHYQLKALKQNKIF